MSRLFIFDMDGTLLPKTTAMLQMAHLLNQSEMLEVLEKQLSDKVIDPIEFSTSVYELSKAFTPDIVKTAFKKSPKLKNIQEGLTTIRSLGAKSCLITSAPEFFAHHFYDYGFDHIYGSNHINLKQEFTPENILHAKDKPVIAKAVCEKYNFSFADAIAFGDSYSDVPLFQTLTHTVSVNGDHHIHNYARHHYSGHDLLEALSLVL